ncbi:MAG TPA: D-glycero-beta-D-manno-heptose 1-phosphate adenylyltransferase [Bacteroidota bacterium]|jgi:D-beta-D-heptose 7-phosphate kinase/D-beta-D-heptose 1-phosphate adenosyltransferase|nr:D-glycero-beta-D-manno-heptose 1-phosphate adenylyltransferase [Bacteroidota bacterium]
MGSIKRLEELKGIRKALRQEHKKVVFTNGCFDIIHRGHIDYLTKAKALGDVLIVGLNTDASVRRNKGEERPIVEEEDRAFVVAHLDPVDYVCLFDENTPHELIAALVPDILIKGADWKIDEIVGKDIVERAGGTVKTIEFLPNRSTSTIIQRIIERYS